MYYEFRQNNSGGHFLEDDNVSIMVIIEACCFAEAKEKAEEIGIYFDGVQKGMDCPCCGDRWSEWSEWQDIVKLPTDESIYIRNDTEKERVQARLEAIGISSAVSENGKRLEFRVDNIEQYGEVFAMDDMWGQNSSCILHLKDGKKVYPPTAKEFHCD